MKKRGSPARIISLALCMLLMLPTAAFAQQTAADYSGHWAEKQIRNFLENGFINLNNDGSYKPDSPITRAEFAAIANKAFGFSEKDSKNFKDVNIQDTFSDDMAIAKKAGYLAGLPDGTVKPNEYMARQEYAVIISRLLKLDIKKDISAVYKFKDAAKIPDWSKGAIGAAVALGYMKGNPDSTFSPQGLITRGQAVVVLERCYLDNVKLAYNTAGTYSAGVVKGSVAINVPDVNLENTEIKGNLIIGEGVGNGNLRLKNITVEGDAIVKGGGPNSIVIENCKFKNIVVIKDDNQIRIVAVGNTTVQNVDMQSGGRLVEQDTTGEGFENVVIAEGIDPKETIVLQGVFESVQILADNAQVDVLSGSIGTLKVGESASNSNINLGSGVNVANMVVDSAATVSGTGNIGTAQVNVQGAVITAPTKTINKPADVTVVTAEPAETKAPTTTSGSSGGGSSSGGRSGGGSGSGGGHDSDDNDDHNNTPNIKITAIPAQSLKVGSTVNVTVSSIPSNAAVSAVSNNTTIAAVSVSGNILTIKGIAPGTAKINVTCTKSGYNSAATSFTVNVTSASAKMIMSDDGNIIEGLENGELITVKLNGKKFVDVLTPSHWELSNLPQGITKGKMTRVSDTEVTIALSGNRSVDYDSDITDVKLYCYAAEVVGEEIPFLCMEGVTLKASDDPETIKLAWAAEPGTNGTEASIDSDALIATLTGGTFVQANIKDITLTGTAETDAHITKETVTWISPTEVKVDLAWDGTDYDENKILTVNVPTNVYVDSKDGSSLTDSITCPASIEQENQTSDIVLSLITPSVSAGNTISVGGSVKTGEVSVLNGTESVVLQAIKSQTQKVEIGGKDAEKVTVKEETTLRPVFTVNTADIAKTGGVKEFTLTVSETGKISIVYSIKVIVAVPAEELAQVEKPVLSAKGVAAWKEVPNAKGYTVQLIRGGEEVKLDMGTQNVSAGVISYDFSALMQGMGSEKYSVKVMATGDGKTCMDGPWSEMSNEIMQLAPVFKDLLWTGDVAHWVGVDNADSYDAYLYRNDIQVTIINVSSEKITEGADFSGFMKEDGTYTFKVVAKGDGATEADARISVASDVNIKGPGADEYYLSKDKDALEIPLGGNSSSDCITEKLGELPLSLPMDTTVIWKSDKETVISNDGQTVTRPTWDAGDVTVTMTAILTNVSATGTKSFELIVKREGNDKEELAADMAALEIPLKSNLGLGRIQNRLGVLPTLLPYGTTVIWESSNEKVLSHNGQTLNRPDWGEEDVAVTMAATLTNGSEKDTKEFNLVVRKRMDGAANYTDSRILRYDGEVYWAGIGSSSKVRVRLYKDDTLVYHADVDGSVKTMNLRSEMLKHGSGVYHVTVQTFGDYVKYEDGNESMTAPACRITLLPYADNLRWEGNTARWAAVGNAKSYVISLYRDGMKEGTSKTVLAEDIGDGVDFTREIEDGKGGSYTFRVQAIGDSRDIADSDVSPDSPGLVKPTQTDNMELELIRPAETGNTIEVGGSVKVGTVRLVNDTKSAKIKGTMKEGQTVKIGGVNMELVAMDETDPDPLAPIFTIDTDNISKGGYIDFTLTVSEAVYSDVIYRIKVEVEGKSPEFTKEGIVQWDDVGYETGYLVQLFVGGRELQMPGATVELLDNTTSYDYSSLMDEVSKTQSGKCKVTVKALGDGKIYQDGPTLESNVVEQLKTPELVYFEHDKLFWDTCADDDYYRILLFKADKSNLSKKEKVTSEEVAGYYGRNGFSFLNKMEANGDGLYYASVTDISKNLINLIQRDSMTCEVVDVNACEVITTSDIGLKLYTPVPDKSNTVTDLGNGIMVVDVASGTKSVVLEGSLTGGQKLTVGEDTSKLEFPILNARFVLDTSGMSEGDSLKFTITVTEEGKSNTIMYLGRKYEVTVAVAASSIGSLYPSVSDDDSSDNMTKIKVGGALGTGNEYVYRNFKSGAVILPVLDEIVSDGWTIVPEDGRIEADNGDSIVVVERRIGTNKAKKVGQIKAVVEAEADTTAPVFDTNYPKAESIGATSITLFAKLDEAGTVYYAVYADGAAAPTAEELKADGGEITVTGSDEVSVDVNGLQAGTYYDIYVIAEDTTGNMQNEIKKVRVKTAD